MYITRWTAVIGVASLQLVFSASCLAGMGSTATNAGLGPLDVASVQAMSIFARGPTATYYNPAALAQDPGSQLHLGLSSTRYRPETRHSTRGKLSTGKGSSEQLMVGVNTDLSALLPGNRPMHLGVLLGLERFGNELISVSAATSEDGQYLRHDRQPLFIGLGLGARLRPGLDLGMGVQINQSSTANVTSDILLGGETRYENLQIHARPQRSAVVGLSVQWDELLCEAACKLSGLSTGLVWREAAWTRTRTSADISVLRNILPISLSYGFDVLDSYQPASVVLGMQYQWHQLTLAVTADWQAWSELEDKLAQDTVRDQADLRFRDTLIPRFAIHYRLSDTMGLTAGLALVPSPLRSGESVDVNYLDNDQQVAGLGWHYHSDRSPRMPRIELGFQYQRLQQRSFDISHSALPAADAARVSSSGSNHSVSAALVFDF